MRAAIMRGDRLVVDELEAPAPGPGEVLVKSLACGICGSDLHTLQHGRRMQSVMADVGGGFRMDLDRDVVMGHEFCAEVLDHGPQTSGALRAGTRVCAMPVLPRADGVHSVGYSNIAHGGYGEQMILNESLLLAVPNGLSTEHAALTEPMAVGWHAVEMARIAADDVPLVIGCGPVGLSVITALRQKGVGPVIAADFSPARRRIAEIMGADVVIDPAVQSPYTRWEELAAVTLQGETLPVDPLSGAQTFRPGVIFECVGVPGVIDQIMAGAKRGTRIVVVGVCMESDPIRPLLGITKELNLQFVLGYTPEEFAATLHQIAEGRINVAPMVTGQVGVEGVAEAFETLGRAEDHVKILVEPWR